MDGQHHGQSRGRVDQYVGHLRKKQLEEGTLTLEKCGFYFTIGRYLPLLGFIDNQRIIDVIAKGQNLFTSIYNGMTATAGIILTLGGQNLDGTDASNDITTCQLQTNVGMKFPDPTVALRIHNNKPAHIWRLGIESSKICGGIPQPQNDEIIIKTLIDAGMANEDAYDYEIAGRVEPAGNGTESIWNLMEVIQLRINGGVKANQLSQSKK